MDAARICADEARDAVEVRRLELAPEAVSEDLLDDRVLEAQALEHFGVRRIACLRLLAHRQAELLEEHDTELLGRVEVEVVARHLVDGGFDLLQAVGDFFRLFGEMRAVDVDAVLLHRGEDLDKRQLNRIHEMRELLLLELRAEQRIEAADGLRLQDGLCLLVVKRLRCRLLQVLLRELRESVLRALRLQEIGSELDIEEGLLPPKAGLVVALEVEDDGLLVRLEQLQERGKGRAVSRHKACLLGVRPRYDGEALERDERREAREDARDGEIRCLSRSLDGLFIPEVVGEVLCGCTIFSPIEVKRQLCRAIESLEVAPDGAQLVVVTEGLHLLHVGLDAVVLLGKSEVRHMELDRRELLREARLVGVRLQVLLELLAGDFPDMREHILDGAVGQQQFRGRLGADARHAWDVVGRIAHESLEVDELQRLKAVLLLEGRRVVILDLRDALLGQEDAQIRPHELQGVAVTRDDAHIVALGRSLRRERADDVIGLVVVFLEERDAHVRGELAQKRELREEFLRRLVARAFVVGIALRAEGVAALVKGQHHEVGLLLGHELRQHVREAEDGPRRLAVRVAETRQCVKGTEDQAAAVEDEEALLLAILFLLHLSSPFCLYTKRQRDQHLPVPESSIIAVLR